jgi:NAD(P)-dependent dehydrogenase (short-subunit alcohol dehydrogenase family)
MSLALAPHPEARPALASRRVAITGASRGIGAACAAACASAGAEHVALIARARSRLQLVAREVERAGASASLHPCDVTATIELVSVLDGLAPLDVLVNCAGANQPEPLLDVQQDTFERLWRLNVQAAFFASQAVARAMIEHRRPGVIVNVSSQMGHVGAALRTVYCTTKHALEGMTRAMAAELGPSGIRVVSVAPTFTHTEMTEAQLRDPEIGPRLLAEIPLGRFADPEDTAAAVVFLASEQARMITGESLKVDGGWTAK